MYRRSQRWMLIINNRFLSLYDYNFLQVIENIFSVNSILDFSFFQGFTSASCGFLSKGSCLQSKNCSVSISKVMFWRSSILLSWLWQQQQSTRKKSRTDPAVDCWNHLFTSAQNRLIHSWWQMLDYMVDQSLDYYSMTPSQAFDQVLEGVMEH